MSVSASVSRSHLRSAAHGDLVVSLKQQDIDKQVSLVLVHPVELTDTDSVLYPPEDRAALQRL